MHTNTSMRIHMYIWIHMCMCTFIHLVKDIYIDLYTCVYIYIYLFIYINNPSYWSYKPTHLSCFVLNIAIFCFYVFNRAGQLLVVSLCDITLGQSERYCGKQDPYHLWQRSLKQGTCYRDRGNTIIKQPATLDHLVITKRDSGWIIQGMWWDPEPTTWVLGGSSHLLSGL